jgi:YgiT-type zinc finger domain-containing protein
MRCENCLIEMLLTKTLKYQYDLSGLENVFLDNIDVYFCSKCKADIPVIPKILKLHNTIANAVVCKKELLSGAEIQFLRKNLRIKSQDWAKLLRTDKSVYSRWENEQKISLQSDLLIRYLYLRLLEEKKGVRLEQKITERLSEMTDEKTAIIINVEQVENYSYLSFDEALRQSENQNKRTLTFDFELNESNLTLSEMEEPLPFGEINNSPFNKSMAKANQELALAA